MTALRVRTGNLTAALVVVVFAELVLHRVIGRLFVAYSPGAIDSGQSTMAQALLSAAPFLFHLAGLLGFMVLTVGVIGAVKRRELFPPAMRLSLTLIGFVFLVLSLYGILRARLPDRYFLYLQISYGFLAALLAAGFLRAPAGRRVKLGVFLFALPGILHAVALFFDRTTWTGRGAVSPSELIRLGEICALLAAVTAPVLLPARPFGTARLGPTLVVATAAAAGLVVALVTSFDYVHSVALYGLRLEIPAPPSPLAFAYVVALFGLTLCALQLLATPGGARLMGYGIILTAATGYQLASPHELVLSLVGISALTVGALRARAADPRTPARVDADAWRGYVSALAGALRGTPPPEAVVVHDDDLEVTRIRCLLDGRPLSLRVLRRDGAVSEFEATVGEAPRTEPDATLSPRLGRLTRPLGPAHGSPRVLTGDPDFDRRFVVRGNAPLSDERLRLHLLQSSAGHIALWRGQAVRYRAVPGKGSALDHPVGPQPLDPQRVIELLGVLRELLDASGESARESTVDSPQSTDRT